MIIYYVNHKGQIINLVAEPYLMLSDTELFNYKYSYNKNRKGQVTDFYLPLEERKVKIGIIGRTVQQYHYNAQSLMEMFDVDTRANVKGKLYYGDYYVECNIIASKKPAKYLLKTISIVEFSIITNNWNWKTSYIEEFGGNDETYVDLDYPHDYSHDYKRIIHTASIENTSYTTSDVIIRIKGRVTDPVISISDNNYGVTGVTIEAGETLVIDSSSGTIYKEDVDGLRENLFNNRLRDFDVFKPIEPGNNLVSWEQDFYFEIELLENRSEPKWDSEGYIPVSGTGLDPNLMLDMIIGEMTNGGN